MLYGIYHVTFQSSLATVGEGVVVFDACCGVHGANESHVFRGTQIKDGETLLQTVEICHLQGEKYPSFGALDAVNVDLEVTETTKEGYRATGCVREASNIRLNVVGRKLGELAVREEGV